MTDVSNSGMTLDNLEGRPVVGSDGEKLGTVADVYFDKDTRQPEWALVTTGLFGTKHSFVPITSASMTGDALQVPFTKQQVSDAPRLDDDGELSQDEEAMLAQHYGLSYSEAPSDSGLPQGGGQPATEPAGGVQDVSGPNTDTAMTLSEERLSVGTMRRPSQLVRMRKDIVSENVSTTVPVEREVLRVEREPITDGNIDQALDGPDLSTEEVELTLTEEQAVVDKEVVPVERIRLDKDVVIEEEQVNETVRREEVEIDQGGRTA